MSEAKNDGGPAFPVADFDHQTFAPKTVDEARRLLSGMTLRDYFAAKALAGMLADLPKTCYGLDWRNTTAREAYELADAMLKARQQ